MNFKIIINIFIFAELNLITHRQVREFCVLIIVENHDQF